MSEQSACPWKKPLRLTPDVGKSGYISYNGTESAPEKEANLIAICGIAKPGKVLTASGGRRRLGRRKSESISLSPGRLVTPSEAEGGRGSNTTSILTRESGWRQNDSATVTFQWLMVYISCLTCYRLHDVTRWTFQVTNRQSVCVLFNLMSC